MYGDNRQSLKIMSDKQAGLTGMTETVEVDNTS